MVHAHNLADAVSRSKKVENWNKRLDAMSDKTGMSRARFCEKYDIDASQLSRHCSGRMNARWETIDKVEKALLKEESGTKKVKKKHV